MEKGSGLTREALTGYLYSYASPLLGSVLITLAGIAAALATGQAVAWQELLVLFGVFYAVSSLGSGICCAVPGVPVYLILRNYRQAGLCQCTALGACFGGGLTLAAFGIPIFGLVGCFYGGLSGYFFALGARRAVTAPSASTR